MLTGNLQKKGAHVNLGGLGVGNGLTDPLVQYEYYAQMAYNYSEAKIGHPVISLQAYESMVAAWPGCKKQIATCNEAPVGSHDSACQMAR